MNRGRAVARRALAGLIAASSFTALAPLAAAQTPPASAQPQPPPGFVPAPQQQQPPPGFVPAPGQQPPPGYPPPAYYPPPPVYYAPPPPQSRPEVLPYVEDQPAPPGYHYDETVSKGLVIGGAVLLGTTYLLTAFSGLIAGAVAEAVEGGNTSDDYAPMYIPVAGPFIAMGTTNPNGGGIGALALLGVAQGGGLAMLIVGMVVPNKRYLRDDVAVVPVPTAGKDGTGLSLVGRF